MYFRHHPVYILIHVSTFILLRARSELNFLHLKRGKGVLLKNNTWRDVGTISQVLTHLKPPNSLSSTLLFMLFKDAHDKNDADNRTYWVLTHLTQNFSRRPRVLRINSSSGKVSGINFLLKPFLALISPNSGK